MAEDQSVQWQQKSNDNLFLQYLKEKFEKNKLTYSECEKMLSDMICDRPSEFILQLFLVIRDNKPDVELMEQTSSILLKYLNSPTMHLGRLTVAVLNQIGESFLAIYKDPALPSPLIRLNILQVVAYIVVATNFAIVTNNNQYYGINGYDSIDFIKAYDEADVMLKCLHLAILNQKLMLLQADRGSKSKEEFNKTNVLLLYDLAKLRLLDSKELIYCKTTLLNTIYTKYYCLMKVETISTIEMQIESIIQIIPTILLFHIELATLFINEMTNLGMEGMHIGESIKTAMFNFATTQQLVLASQVVQHYSDSKHRKVKTAMIQLAIHFNNIFASADNETTPAQYMSLLSVMLNFYQEALMDSQNDLEWKSAKLRSPSDSFEYLLDKDEQKHYFFEHHFRMFFKNLFPDTIEDIATTLEQLQANSQIKPLELCAVNIAYSNIISYLTNGMLIKAKLQATLEVMKNPFSHQIHYSQLKIIQAFICSDVQEDIIANMEQIFDALIYFATMNEAKVVNYFAYEVLLNFLEIASVEIIKKKLGQIFTLVNTELLKNGEQDEIKLYMLFQALDTIFQIKGSHFKEFLQQNKESLLGNMLNYNMKSNTTLNSNSNSQKAVQKSLILTLSQILYYLYKSGKQNYFDYVQPFQKQLMNYLITAQGQMQARAHATDFFVIDAFLISVKMYGCDVLKYVNIVLQRVIPQGIAFILQQKAIITNKRLFSPSHVRQELEHFLKESNNFAFAILDLLKEYLQITTRQDFSKIEESITFFLSKCLYYNKVLIEEFDFDIYKYESLFFSDTFKVFKLFFQKYKSVQDGESKMVKFGKKFMQQCWVNFVKADTGHLVRSTYFLELETMFKTLIYILKCCHAKQIIIYTSPNELQSEIDNFYIINKKITSRRFNDQLMSHAEANETLDESVSQSEINILDEGDGDSESSEGDGCRTLSNMEHMLYTLIDYMSQFTEMHKTLLNTQQIKDLDAKFGSGKVTSQKLHSATITTLDWRLDTGLYFMSSLIADITQQLALDAIDFDTYVQVFQKFIVHKDVMNAQNCAFGLGELAARLEGTLSIHCIEAIIKAINSGEALKTDHFIIDANPKSVILQQDYHDYRDNIFAAYGKVIHYHVLKIVVNNTLFTPSLIQNWLKYLPLSSDVHEGVQQIQLLVNLIQKYEMLIVGANQENLKDIIRIFGFVLMKNSENQQKQKWVNVITTKQMQDILKKWASKAEYKNQIQQIYQQMENKVISYLMLFLSQEINLEQVAEDMQAADDSEIDDQSSLSEAEVAQ